MGLFLGFLSSCIGLHFYFCANTYCFNDYSFVVQYEFRWLCSIGALSAGSCDRRSKRGREELPYVRGQGQKPGGRHARRAAAKRSYPTSEVRGGSQECQAAMAQEQPRGPTPHLRSGVVAGRSYPTPQAQGQGQQPGGATHVQGQGQRPGGPTPRPRSHGCTGTGGPRGAILR